MARIAGTQILNGDEVYAADQLIDLGPAPPLPGKDDLFTGGGGGGGGPASGSGGGGGTAFQYPAQRPGGTPFQYPNQGATPAGAQGKLAKDANC